MRRFGDKTDYGPCGLVADSSQSSGGSLWREGRLLNPHVDICSDGLCDGTHDGNEHVLVVLLEGTMNLVLDTDKGFMLGKPSEMSNPID